MAVLAGLRVEHRRWIASHGPLLDELRRQLSDDEFTAAVVELILELDPQVESPVSARQEARRLLSLMLANSEVAIRLLSSGARVIVIPRHVRMTDIPPFERLRGRLLEGESAGGRCWDAVRGSGGLQSAVTEENLLGEISSVAGEISVYAHGYSTTTHEIAHTIHQYGLTDADRVAIHEAYLEKRSTSEEWPDGSRPYRKLDGKWVQMENYSSSNELEYFAQLTNAYLGTNHGVDLVKKNTPKKFFCGVF
ncbi:hypothetical protein ACFXPJ_29485 [Streptomyces goshikiensis]